MYRWTLNQTDFEQVPSAIMVWRNQKNQVCVEVLSPLFAFLIEKLNQEPLSAMELHQLIGLTLPDLSVPEIDRQLNELSNLLCQFGLIYIPQDYLN